jgi:ABC-type sugar transport system ATPase subunit
MSFTQPFQFALRSIMLGAARREHHKRFPGVLAVNRVSIAVSEGEILALVGENGAGKSTLMQILGGAFRPDEGQITLEGNPVSFYSPEDAIRAGISMVFQELSMVGSLSVSENIFANRQPTDNFNNIRWRSSTIKPKPLEPF